MTFLYNILQKYNITCTNITVEQVDRRKKNKERKKGRK